MLKPGGIQRRDDYAVFTCAIDTYSAYDLLPKELQDGPSRPSQLTFFVKKEHAKEFPKTIKLNRFKCLELADFAFADGKLIKNRFGKV